MTDDLQEFYGGVEPVDTGNLDDIKEQRTVIPKTKRVKLQIKSAEIDTHNLNYRVINLQTVLVDGIEEEQEDGSMVAGKFKNKSVFTRICYFADPTKYTKDFFKNRQHLLPLKQLGKATGVDLTKIDGYTPGKLTSAPHVYGDIVITTSTYNDKDTGESITRQDNEVRNWKPVSVEELV